MNSSQLIYLMTQWTWVNNTKIVNNKLRMINLSFEWSLILILGAIKMLCYDGSERK